jgi:hypothetical protein
VAWPKGDHVQEGRDLLHGWLAVPWCGAPWCVCPVASSVGYSRSEVGIPVEPARWLASFVDDIPSMTWPESASWRGGHERLYNGNIIWSSNVQLSNCYHGNFLTRLHITQFPMNNCAGTDQCAMPLSKHEHMQIVVNGITCDQPETFFYIS